MPKPFEALRDRLLRAGVAPRHVNRYLVELGEHLIDLTETERGRGAGNDAAARALAQLGTDDALAEAMIHRSRLRSWSARAPWAAYLLAPAAVLSLGVGLAAALVMAVVDAYRPAGGGHPILPFWFLGLTTAESFAVTILLPLLLGWAIAVQATRQRIASFWPALGLATIAIIGGGTELTVILPTATGQPGQLGISCFGEPIVAAARATLNLALTLAPYLLWRRHVSALRRMPATA
jgi:hypothetical protein